MYPYVLTSTKQDINDWLYLGVDGRNKLAFVPRRVTINCNLNEDGEDFYKLGTWYCRTKTEAKELAKVLASRLPGTEIQIFKLDSIAKAPAAAAVFANYSEKGLIPE